MSPGFDHIQAAAVAVHSTHHAAQMPGHCGRPLHATVVCMVLNCPDFALDSVSDIATVTPHAERIWGDPSAYRAVWFVRAAAGDSWCLTMKPL